MSKKVRIANIEAGMPVVEVARKRMLFEISTAKREGLCALKIIHGYGSTGTGGRLKDELRKTLAEKKKEGMIKVFVSGEDWSIFNQSARDILAQCPELRQDRDLENHNQGISIILL